MIIRQFLAWTQHGSPTRRAEAAGALARAYLYGGLAPEIAREAEVALLALLDDPSQLVRRTLAEACAGCATAPRPLIVTLAADQPEIAGLVLARSPVLTDADLVDGLAIGCAATRRAIAGRRDLSPAVAGAMAEIAEAAALVALIRNRTARITTGSLLRMVERHGDDADLREAMLARPNLPLEIRQAVTTRLAEVLSAFAVASGWLTPMRSERTSREAQERSTLAFSAGAHPVDLARLVTHLRHQGQLNAGLLLRAILSGHMSFAERALADLSGLAPDRVAGLMRDGSAAFAALHRKAGLPSALLPAFTAALSAWHEAGRGMIGSAPGALSRRMIARALTACEAMPFAEAQGVMALLARFEAEAAREDARLTVREMVEAAEHAAAQALENEILDAEWREAQRQVAHRPEAESAPKWDIAIAGETDATEETGRTDPVGLILDALPGEILAEFRNERDRSHAVAVTVVLDTLPEALVASYRADRERVRLAA